MAKRALEGTKADAAEMSNAGMSVEQIAEELDVSVQTVYRYLRELALPREPKGWEEAREHVGEIVDEYLQGISIAEIARKNNTTPYCVNLVLLEEKQFTNGSEARRTAKETREKVIVEAYKSGQRIVDISAQHNVGQAHIYTILARHGLKPARRLQ